MQRLFTGLEVPSDLALRLSLLGAPLKGARWIKPENMHVTLCFGGDMDGHAAEEWLHALSMVDADAFTLKITTLGLFGTREPTSIWAGLDGGDGLSQLHNAHVSAARRAGVPLETRKFVPHITLARLRSANKTEVADYLQSHPTLDLPAFPVRQAVMFSSRPGKGGGPYAVEESFELGEQHQYAPFDNDNF